MVDDGLSTRLNAADRRVSSRLRRTTVEMTWHPSSPVLETGPLLPQDHKSGTVCRPISDCVGCHTASSGGY